MIKREEFSHSITREYLLENKMTHNLIADQYKEQSLDYKAGDVLLTYEI